MMIQRKFLDQVYLGSFILLCKHLFVLRIPPVYLLQLISKYSKKTCFACIFHVNNGLNLIKRYQNYIDFAIVLYKTAASNGDSS